MNFRIVLVALFFFFLVHMVLGMETHDHEAGPSSRPGGSQHQGGSDQNDPPQFQRSRMSSEGPAPSTIRNPTAPVRRGRRVRRQNTPVGQKKRARILADLQRKLDDPAAIAEFNIQFHQQCTHQHCHDVINGDRLLKIKKKYWTEKTEALRTAFLTQFFKQRQHSGKCFL